MNRRRITGFTLIEVIIFIVVVSAGLAGILVVSNSVVRTSADPLLNKQALAIAESLLEEIVLKDFCDPDTVDRSTTPPTCGTHTTEATRNLYDDVDDYDGYSTTVLTNYNVAVTVLSTTDLSGVASTNARKITVSVTYQGDAAVLIGYRSNF